MPCSSRRVQVSSLKARRRRQIKFVASLISLDEAGKRPRIGIHAWNQNQRLPALPFLGDCRRLMIRKRFVVGGKGKIVAAHVYLRQPALGALGSEIDGNGPGIGRIIVPLLIGTDGGNEFELEFIRDVSALHADQNSAALHANLQVILKQVIELLRPYT